MDDNLRANAKKEWIDWAYEQIRAGASTTYCTDHIEFKKRCSRRYAVYIVDLAVNRIKDENVIEREEVVAIHLGRYNNIIEYGLSLPDPVVPNDTGDPNEDAYAWIVYRREIERKRSALINSFNAMGQKEVLLGIHKKDFKYVENENINIKIVEKKPLQSLSKLSFEDQIRLYELLKKSRLGEDELLGITAAPENESVVTEDIEAEVVEVPNISLIKNKEIEAPPVVSQITQFDPTKKFRELLKQKAAEKFKTIGANLDEKEEKYLNK